MLSSFKSSKNCSRKLAFQKALDHLLFQCFISALPQIEGILLKPILATKAQVRYLSYPGLYTSQQITSLSKVSNGICRVSNPLSETRGTHSIHRHPRCLSTCSHLPTSSAASTFFSGRWPHSARHIALRLVLCSQDVNKDLSTLACPYPNSGHPGGRLCIRP